MPILPLYITGPLGGSEEQVGLIIGAFSFTAVLMRPIAGFLLDRHGRRKWLLSASALFCVLMFSYLFARDWASLLVCRLLHGLSWGMVGVAAATVAADIIPPARRGTGIGYYGISMPLALSIGPMLGFFLLAGHRFNRLFIVAGMLAITAFTLFSLIRMPLIHRSRSRFSLNNIFEPKVLHLFFFMFLLCIGYGGIIAFASLHSQQVGMESGAAFFTLYAIGSLFCRVGAGAMYDRSGPILSVTLGLTILIGGWVCLAAWPSPAGVMLGGLLLGVGFGLLMATYQTMAMDMVEPEHRATANGTIFSAYDVGITIGAMGLGVVAGNMGIRAVFLLSGALTMCAAIYFFTRVYPHFVRHRLSTPVSQPGGQLKFLPPRR